MRGSYLFRVLLSSSFLILLAFPVFVDTELLRSVAASNPITPMTTCFKTATVSPFPGLLTIHEARLTAADGASGDGFGTCLGIDGDTAVIGAPNKNFDQGAAYVYTRSGETWIQAAKLTASDGEMGDFFGGSVAISGDTVLVGASRWHSGPLTPARSNAEPPAAPYWHGVVYVFEKGAGWTDGSANQAAILSATDAADENQFGVAIAMDGDTAVISAGVLYPRKAYVFEKGGGWSDGSGNCSAVLTASGTTEGQSTNGPSVAVVGDTVVVGYDSNANSQGSAYIFVKPSGGWATTSTPTAELTASDGAASHLFGTAVSVSGDIVLVGAPDADSYVGAAYVFARPTSGWADMTETIKLTASDSADGDEFGWSVAVGGDDIIIGDFRFHSTPVLMPGKAYMYHKPEGGWSSPSSDPEWDPTSSSLTESSQITASDQEDGDSFGISVALDASTAVVGASEHGSGGAAYVYRAQHTVTVSCSAGGTTDKTGTNLVWTGGSFTVVATASAGFAFSGWSGTGVPGGHENDNPLNIFNITADLGITANFSPLPGSLNVDVTPEDLTLVGGGVKYTISGPPGFISPGDLTTDYTQLSAPAGTYVITFDPAPVGWSRTIGGDGTLAGDQVTLELTVSGVAVTAAYTRLTGSLSVSIDPQEVRPQAAWRRAGTGIWFKHNQREDGIPTGVYTLEFLDTLGWQTPAVQTVTINPNVETKASAVYTPVYGSLRVEMRPDRAVEWGAKWSLDGGTWYGSGETLSLQEGFYSLKFMPPPGFFCTGSPPMVSVERGELTSYTAVFGSANGSLLIHLLPPGGGLENATWTFSDSYDWEQNGSTFANNRTVALVPAREHTLTISKPEEWVGPEMLTVTVAANVANEFSYTYTRRGTKLTVYFSNKQDKAGWRLKGEIQWRVHGACYDLFPSGTRNAEVEFKPVGLLTIPARTVNMSPDAGTEITVSYPPSPVIRGRLLDVFGEPVPGERVIVTGPGSAGGLLEAVSSFDGTFRFTDLPCGTYAVSFSSDLFDFAYPPGAVGATNPQVYDLGDISGNWKLGTLTISGHVLDAETKSTERMYPKVQLDGPDGARVTEAFWGGFSFNGLKPGKYTLSVLSNEGFSSVGEKSSAVVTLKRSSFYSVTLEALRHNFLLRVRIVRIGSSQAGTYPKGLLFNVDLNNEKNKYIWQVDSNLYLWINNVPRGHYVLRSSDGNYSADFSIGNEYVTELDVYPNSGNVQFLGKPFTGKDFKPVGNSEFQFTYLSGFLKPLNKNGIVKYRGWGLYADSMSFPGGVIFYPNSLSEGIVLTGNDTTISKAEDIGVLLRALPESKRCMIIKDTYRTKAALTDVMTKNGRLVLKGRIKFPLPGIDRYADEVVNIEPDFFGEFKIVGEHTYDLGDLIGIGGIIDLPGPSISYNKPLMYNIFGGKYSFKKFTLEADARSFEDKIDAVYLKYHKKNKGWIKYPHVWYNDVSLGVWGLASGKPLVLVGDILIGVDYVQSGKSYNYLKVFADGRFDTGTPKLNLWAKPILFKFIPLGYAASELNLAQNYLWAKVDFDYSGDFVISVDGWTRVSLGDGTELDFSGSGEASVDYNVPSWAEWLLPDKIHLASLDLRFGRYYFEVGTKVCGVPFAVRASDNSVEITKPGILSGIGVSWVMGEDGGARPVFSAPPAPPPSPIDPGEEFEVRSGLQELQVLAAWEKNNSGIRLVGPNGLVYDAALPDQRFTFEPLSIGRGGLFTVPRPAAGHWRVDLDNTGSLGQIYIEPFEILPPAAVAVTSVEQHGDRLFLIKLARSAIEGEAVSLYAEPIGEPDKAALIAASDQLGASYSCVWDASGLPPGEYYIKAVAFAPGVDQFQYRYPEAVKLEASVPRVDAAPKVKVLRDDTVRITWRPVGEESVAGYCLTLHRVGGEGEVLHFQSNGKRPVLELNYEQLTPGYQYRATVTAIYRDEGTDILLQSEPSPTTRFIYKAGTRNNYPVIINRPSKSVIAGRTWRFAPKVKDLDRDRTAFNLVRAPEVLDFDGSTGSITWKTSKADIGFHKFLLRVVDEKGASALLTWSVRVRDPEAQGEIQFYDVYDIDGRKGLIISYRNPQLNFSIEEREQVTATIGSPGDPAAKRVILREADSYNGRFDAYVSPALLAKIGSRSLDRQSFAGSGSGMLEVKVLGKNRNESGTFRIR